jgi:hypothetical protein
MKLNVSIGTALILAAAAAACSPAAQEPAGEAGKAAPNMAGLSQTNPNLSASELGKIAKDTLSSQSGEEAIIRHVDREMARRGLESPVAISDEERHQANLEMRAARQAGAKERAAAADWAE